MGATKATSAGGSVTEGVKSVTGRLLPTQPQSTRDKRSKIPRSAMRLITTRSFLEAFR